MQNAAFIQRLNAQTIKSHGMTISVGDVTLFALTRSLSAEEHAYLPEGTENALFTDLRAYILIPTEMSEKNLPMNPGTVFLDAGTSFTVLAPPLPVREAGVAVEQVVIACRTPEADSTVAVAEQHQDDIWTTREVSP